MNRLGRATIAVLAFASCRTPPGSSSPEWKLSETLRIGAEGRPETEFHRVAGAVRLANGEIAVADRGSNRVRYFGPDGTFRRSFGREGAGPGEFRSMGRLIRFGDTLAIHDLRNGRLTLFRSDSLLLTLTVRAANSTAHFSIDDRLADGRWLAGTAIAPRFSTHPYRDSIAVGIFPASADGEVQLLRWFPGPWVVSIEGQLTGLAGFLTWVSSRAVGREILVLDTDQERIRRFALDGTELPGAAIPVPGEPLTPDLIERAKRQETSGGLDSLLARKWLEARYDPAVLPGRLPFRGFIADSDGLIWLEEYPVDHAPRQYFVLSPDGQLVAVVTAPAGFRATDIGPDYCLGVETDPDGVERIALYRLTRN